jgi:hypothetical protein
MYPVLNGEQMGITNAFDYHISQRHSSKKTRDVSLSADYSGCYWKYNGMNGIRFVKFIKIGKWQVSDSVNCKLPSRLSASNKP